MITKVRVGRVVAVTLGLVSAGFLFGAIAGGTAFTLVTLPGGGISEETFFIGAVFGAPLGAVCAPVLSWLLLRRVPLGRMFLVCSAGTVIGGMIGAITTTLGGDFILRPIAGAFLGCFAAAAALWYRARARSGSAMPSVR
jgi:hypothetical protein